ncbi:MAG: molybdenum ABC transporter ATP-binding protein [Mariniphaga sp.]|nr:molybdenum ABC transporter ATP-binding protein [Mariniphaga sp.]
MGNFLKINISLRIDSFVLNIVQEFPSGITGIYGPSGQGKTTLLNAIAGIITPNEGNISINDECVFDKKNKKNIPVRNRRIGYLFQNDRLFPHLTILKNLKYGLKLNSRIGLDEVVEILDIRNLLSKLPDECSGGERQRVALGRALLSSPNLLLLDEPFAAVDVKLRENIIPYLVDINRMFQIPMLVVSHDLPDLLSLTNYLILLNDGKISASGLFRDLIANEKNLTIMQGAGIYNAFDLLVFEFFESNNIVLLKSFNHEFKIQAISSSFQTKIERDSKVKVLIRPEDIAVSLAPVEGISLRNQIPGKIEKVFSRNGYSFCLVDAGEKLLVEITEASRKKMNLEPGQNIYCLFKSVALKIY